MSRETVDSVLKSISSLELDNAISESYTGVEESIRQSGAPSNNTLLSIIASEIRRGNDETVKLNSSITKLNESMNSSMEKLLESIETQNTILASMKVSSDGKPQQNIKGRSGTDDWYYKGVKLGSRHHVVACIISQMMSIVQLQIDQMNIQYPDSVDCEFNIMVTIVRVVCSNPCRSKFVEYKASIQLKAISNQAFDTIYPYVASTEQKFPTTLTESTLNMMVNPITRDVMQEAEYVRERLCLMDCIFSARQIDILKSIRFPFTTDNRLNWTSVKIRSKTSHPLTQEIMALASKQKEAYAKCRLEGKGIVESHDMALKSSKK
jgi:hypothetical protein